MSKKWAIYGVVTIAVVALFFVWRSEANKPDKLDAFATCLKDRGAIFYGAFWCPHCQNQKAMFGRSQKLLNYVECSTPNGQAQLPFCTKKGIEGYPTWEFKDGSRLSGEVALETLAEKTGCELPATQ